jgi:hypothetical protein
MLVQHEPNKKSRFNLTLNQNRDSNQNKTKTKKTLNFLTKTYQTPRKMKNAKNIEEYSNSNLTM